MPVQDSPGQELRRAVLNSTLPVPGAPSALVALLAQEIGFSAVYLSGGALSANVLALPDVGLVTLTELAQQTTYIARRVTIPVIVDADTGFGEAEQVQRTVDELESAGAAALQLEDQQPGKRCGHLAGKRLVDCEAMCAKLAAAAHARRDPDLVLIARTDARGVEGFSAAVQRARAYLEAGADWIFPEALTSPEEFERFAEQVEAPLVANMTEFGQSPLLTVDELAELGYAVVLFPVTLLRVALRAIEASLMVLSEQGSQRELLDLMMSRDQLYELLGYDPGVGTRFEIPPSEDGNRE